jgi:hypothetical protein
VERVGGGIEAKVGRYDIVIVVIVVGRRRRRRRRRSEEEGIQFRKVGTLE